MLGLTSVVLEETHRHICFPIKAFISSQNVATL